MMEQIMDQSWEIIGIVIAVLMVIIGLRLLLKKPQPLPPVNAADFYIEAMSQQPVIPRQARDVALAPTSTATTQPMSETNTADTEKLAVEAEKALTPQSVQTDHTARTADLDELKAEIKAEPELLEEAKALETAAQHKNAQQKSEQEEQHIAEISKPDMQSLQLSDDDWENESTVFDAHLSEQDRNDEESALATAQKIVALYVYPNPERALSGERTLKMLLKYGLRFGELSCFHRYEHAEHVSPLMFSVLRVHEDGTPTGFDLETLPTEEVKGLAFFLALPNPHAIQGFDMMASIAGLIARDTDGLVFDEQSLELTQQLREHWRHYVIEYDPNQIVG